MPDNWLIIMAKFAAVSTTSLHNAVLVKGLDRRLGRAMSPPGKWHQSLSSQYEDTPGNVEKLMRACAHMKASQIVLTFDHIIGPEPHLSEKIHWEFRGKGNAKHLDALFAVIKAALDEQGVPHSNKKRAHITVSYSAPTTLDPIAFAPVSCTIDEILLIRSGGIPHRHEILGRWPLTPPPNPVGLQLDFSF